MFFAPDEESRKDKLNGHKALQELMINKLNYREICLVGREEEVDTLRSCNYRAAQSPSVQKQVKKEFVVIQGYSGVGKSKIAEIAQSYVKEITNGTVVHGKFDQNALSWYWRDKR